MCLQPAFSIFISMNFKTRPSMKEVTPGKYLVINIEIYPTVEKSCSLQAN